MLKTDNGHKYFLSVTFDFKLLNRKKGINSFLSNQIDNYVQLEIVPF
jgi:hypothetical protein